MGLRFFMSRALRGATTLRTTLPHVAAYCVFWRMRALRHLLRCTALMHTEHYNVMQALRVCGFCRRRFGVVLWFYLSWLYLYVGNPTPFRPVNRLCTDFLGHLPWILRCFCIRTQTVFARIPVFGALSLAQSHGSPLWTAVFRLLCRTDRLLHFRSSQ